MGEKQIVESFARQSAAFRPLAQQVRSGARSRMVWFVALCGFVILNGKTLWDSIAQAYFSGLPLALLIFPWVIAALFAVITHFIIDEVDARDNLYIAHQSAALDLYLESLDEGDADPREMIAIMHDSTDELKAAKSELDKYSKRAQLFERITFACVVAGFVWSLVGPFLLVYIIRSGLT
ncbi:MAG: hypothetical protein HOP27_09975 [Anaerolineales bacterium]|nr:hypothetical protein [Anaerolineales bacterium]